MSNNGTKVFRKYCSNDLYMYFYSMSVHVSSKYSNKNFSSLDYMVRTRVRNCVRTLFSDSVLDTYEEKKKAMHFLLIDAPLFIIDIYYNSDIEYDETENVFNIVTSELYKNKNGINHELTTFLSKVLEIEFVKVYILQKKIDEDKLFNTIINNVRSYAIENYYNN